MTIALVTGQVASGTTASGSSLTITLPNNPTVGNFVVVGWDDNGTQAETITVKDGAATPNTYSAATGSPFTPTNAVSGHCGINFLQNAGATANKSITVSGFPAGTTIDAWAAEFSGVATSSAQDGSAVTQSNTTSSTSISTPSFTPTVSGDLLMAVTIAGQTISAANSPWNMVNAVENGDAGAYAILTSSSAQAINETQAPAGEWAIIIAGFKAAASADVLQAQICL